MANKRNRPYALVYLDVPFYPVLGGTKRRCQAKTFISLNSEGMLVDLHRKTGYQPLKIIPRLLFQHSSRREISFGNITIELPIAIAEPVQIVFLPPAN